MGLWPGRSIEARDREQLQLAPPIQQTHDVINKKHHYLQLHDKHSDTYKSNPKAATFQRIIAASGGI